MIINRAASSTLSNIGPLPSGFRPNIDSYGTVSSGSGGTEKAGYIQVKTTGHINIIGISSGSAAITGQCVYTL